MAEFILSAFADEAAEGLDEQLEALAQENIRMIELRCVDGVNCSELGVEDAVRIHKKLEAHHVTLSALGSPYGKIGIMDSFDEHFDKFARSMEVCKVLECSRIRMFSFYIPQGEEPEKYRGEVFRRLERMVELARKNDVLLVHENEKGIYGDTDTRCMDLYEHFGGDMGVAFDPANYVQCGVDPLEAYRLHKDIITYFHIKDAMKEDGSVVSAGRGDGHLPEILEDVDKVRSGEVILTVEPHLHIFNGLGSLQSESLLHKESYPDSRTAFHAACEALKKIIQKIV